MSLNTYPYAKRGGGGAAFLIAAACFLAAIVGVGISVLPWQFVAVGTIVLVLAPLVLIYPELGVLTILALIYEVIPGRLVPDLPLGAGKLKIYDAIFIATAFVVVIRTWWQKRSVLQPIKVVIWPLLYTYTCIVVALVYGRLVLGNKLAISEARGAICWLMLPLLLLLIDTPKKFRIFVNILLAIAVIVSIYGALQSFMDIRILSHRVEDISGGMIQEGGVTRSLLGAASFLAMFAIYYCIMAANSRRMSWTIATFVVVVSALGLAVSFTRALWISAFVGGLLAFYLYRGVVATIFATIGVVVAVGGALVVVSAVKPVLAQSVIERAAGIGDEIRTGGSFNWRRLENEAAWKVIEQHPFIGVGLGGEYKKVKTFIGDWQGEYNFIHNGYMFYPLKMGLHAFIIPFIFMALFIAALIRAVATAQSADRIVPAAAAGVFLALSLATYTEPHWVRGEGLVTISAMLALVMLTPRLGMGATAIAPDAIPVPVRLRQSYAFRPK